MSNKETIDEAAERLIRNFVGDEMSRDDKRLYAICKSITDDLIKHQAKTMYSKEEVLAMLLIKHDGLTPEYVFEQFNKQSKWK